MNSVKNSMSIPSKVFLLGEYAVLIGLPAFVVSLQPRFKMIHSDNNINNAGSPLHPHSPAGKLLAWMKDSVSSELPCLKFQDPHLESGGFGASSAQFALTYYFLAEQFQGEKNLDLKLDVQTVWTWYRKVLLQHHVSGAMPSGADLVGQWLGGMTVFEFLDDQRISVQSVAEKFKGSNLMYFSTKNRKTQTHEHLRSVKTDSLPKAQMKNVLTEAIVAMEEKDLEKFGSLMNTYSEILSGAGFENECSRRDRLEIQKIPGALGAKGCGANLSDAFVVLVKDLTSDRKWSVIRQVEAMGLKWLPQESHFSIDSCPVRELGIS